MSKYRDYVEELRRDNGSAPGVPAFKGPYPPSEEVTINGVKQYLISTSFRAPAGLRTMDDTGQFAGFMLDGFPYAREADYRLIQYVSGTDWFALESCGPDSGLETEWLSMIYRERDRLSREAVTSLALVVRYDPTNGEISRGDVLEVYGVSGMDK